jgi:ribosomal subunit interface protein
MQINVAGKQINLSDSLRTRVTAHLDVIADKYFDDALEANVTFGRARSFFTCDINVRAARGLLLRGEGEAADAHSAFDDAAEHIAKRLRRYRRRVNEHSRDFAQRRRPEIGRQYILRQEEEEQTPRLTPQADGMETAPALPPSGTYATIIAEQPTDIAHLTVGEAVMQLDLADQMVLMFRNSASGEINVVYRRSDGHIGWLDPTGG